MSNEEIQGIICFIAFVLFALVFTIRHIINEKKKHGKYLTRRKLAKLAIHSALFVFVFLLLYFIIGFSHWISILILIIYGSSIWVISDKFNDD